MEKDDEVKGDGNSYTTEFRQYDPRLGRWLSLDPLMMQFPHMSPYCAFDNNPIYFVDPYGLSSGNPDGDPELDPWEIDNDLNRSDPGLMGDGPPQKYTTPLGKTPNADEMSNYKYDTDDKKWSVGNDWRIKGDPEFKKDLDNVAKYAEEVRSLAKNKYGLDDSRLKGDVTFEYSDNNGEPASFRLNMYYVSKDGNSRIKVRISFYELNQWTEEYSLDKVYMDEIKVQKTNCYAYVLGIIGNIDSDEDFYAAAVGDGYVALEENATPKIGDLVWFKGAHVMEIIGKKDGKFIYRSNNRNDEVMEGTFEKIDQEQFDGQLSLGTYKKFILRKR